MKHLPLMSTVSSILAMNQKQLTIVSGKKIIPKFTNILKYLYMNSQQQPKKVTKNHLVQCGFLRTMLT